MEKDIVMNTGTRAFTAGIMTEAVNVLYDCRWTILAIIVVVVADLWYGRSESAKRYQRARETGNDSQILEYRWRTSRAVRRTVNKFIDYLLWLCVSAAIGMAVLTPIGLDYMYMVVGATMLAMFCEIKSVAGHLLYLHDMDIPTSGITEFFKAVLVAFVKRKDEDLGEAIEDGFAHSRYTKDEKGNSHNDDNRHVARGRVSRRV